MRQRIPGCDYCRQCNTDFIERQPSPEHKPRRYCACQWATRLRQVEGALLEQLREDGDDVARRELMRRMLPAAV